MRVLFGATELIGLADSRTPEHLRPARDLSRRTGGDDGGIGRAMANVLAYDGSLVW